MNRAIGQQLVVNGVILGCVSDVYKEAHTTYIQIDDSYEIPVQEYVEVIDLTGKDQQIIPNLQTPYIRAIVL